MGFVFKTINNTLLLILPIITGTINRISAFLRSLQQDIQAISKFLEKNKEILQRLLLVIGVGVVYKIKTLLSGQFLPARPARASHQSGAYPRGHVVCHGRGGYPRPSRMGAEGGRHRAQSAFPRLG